MLTPAQKSAHLLAFWREKVQRPMVLVGASLGGAIALEFAMQHPEVGSWLSWVTGTVSAAVFGRGNGAVLLGRWLVVVPACAYVNPITTSSIQWHPIACTQLHLPQRPWRR